METTQTRFFLLSEDFNSDRALFITNLSKYKLMQVLARILDEIENGTGRPAEEVAADLFDDNADIYLKELDAQDAAAELAELKTREICTIEEFSFLEVLGCDI